jgi:uncharacterized DUF497 family protein
VDITYDPAKNEKNIAERGLSFELVRQIDMSQVLIEPDERFDYGERRFGLLGLIDGRVHNVVFCMRGAQMRVISLRKANKKEITIYENTIN